MYGTWISVHPEICSSSQKRARGVRGMCYVFASMINADMYVERLLVVVLLSLSGNRVLWKDIFILSCLPKRYIPWQWMMSGYVTRQYSELVVVVLLDIMPQKTPFKIQSPGQRPSSGEMSNGIGQSSDQDSLWWTRSGGGFYFVNISRM